MKVVDLCSGTGAFSHIAESLGCQVVLSNDFEKNSKVIHDANVKTNHLLLKDIHDIATQDFPDHDLLCAGFPCQPFSIAGDRKGFNDDRSNVLVKIFDVLKVKQPSYFILENVKNIVTHDNGKTFDLIKETLTDLNYNIQYKILDTAIYTDIPQHRERLYIVGTRVRTDVDFFDTMQRNIDNSVKMEWCLDIENIKAKYIYTDRFKIYSDLERDVIKENVFYQYRRVYTRENKSGVCPTLTANMGTGGHNVPIIKQGDIIRKLTPRECFNLQGFPQNYVLPSSLSDSALYKLAGNAITYPIAKRLMERVKEVIASR
jgi:DNA (cytosine-5)-methyltransferase 1